MTKDKHIDNLSIIRTILWFSGCEMPSDEEIIKCYKNAQERFKKILKEEIKDNETK